MDNLIKEKSAGVMRKGEKVNMEELLDEMDAQYLSDLNASIESFDTYEEVSNEMYNDYKCTCAKLNTLNRLGYLDEEETDVMIQTAAEIRLKKLEELEHDEKQP